VGPLSKAWRLRAEPTSVVIYTVGGTRPEVSHATSALLWDLDNVSPPWTDLASLAEALGALVEPGAPQVAAANWRAFNSCRSTLRAHGIRVICGGHKPEGADNVLLRQARRLGRRGVERFIVASNDHAFARIAHFAELHVVTLTVEYVSGRLRTNAQTVTVLRHDSEGWRAISSDG
jgi:hypothetical protein